MHAPPGAPAAGWPPIGIENWTPGMTFMAKMAKSGKNGNFGGSKVAKMAIFGVQGGKMAILGGPGG